jgi:peptide/nickel transport system permease protein
MRRYLARRLGLLLLTLWLMSLAIFAIVQILPGDVARVVLGQFATPSEVAALRHQLGLDQPLPVRYLQWIGGFIAGRWGQSYYLDVPVDSVLPAALLNSLILAAVALIVVVPVSIAAGTLAALRRDRLTDRTITIAGLSLLAVPEFVSGLILIFIFGIRLHWLPTGQLPAGNPLASPQYLIMPALALGGVLFGYFERMQRSSTADVLESNFVRTAVLKGIPRRQVLGRHVLRNALVPTLTIVASQIGYLVGGLVVVEKLFGYPGIGNLLYQAALHHDAVLLEDCTLVVACIYMLANLSADLLYALLNPRIRYA